jgi:hypothetical protein
MEVAMKRILCILFVLFVAFGAFAQTYDFSQFQTGFTNFAQDVANSLPFNASIGLNWSDAYIGQLIAAPPHFGIGVTMGVTTIPFESIDAVLTATGMTLPPDLEFLRTYGVPLPAYTVDARIGGFILPFDIGIKVGYLAPEWVRNLGLAVDVDYLMVGADVRYALLKQNVILPAISVGAGYTFMRGGVGVPGILNGPITIGNFEVPDGMGGTTTYVLGFTDPAVNFSWKTNVIDLKAQISKSFLIVTPYLGLGASYGISSAGGGLVSSLTIDGSPATAEQIQQLNDLLEAAGAGYTLSNQGFDVQASANGWAFRAFGGFSLNILVIRLDVTGMYNFTSGSYGGSLNLRFQL